MDFMVNAVANFLAAATKLLPNWTFTHNIANDVNTITPYLQKANTLLPIGTALTLAGLYISIQLALMALYWIDRIINLIRGAG
jgi:hypothetical protein